MPTYAALTERGKLLLSELPGWIQDDPDMRGVVHAYARESERMEQNAAEVRDNFIAARATALLLRAWERTVRTTEEPSGKSVAQRVAVIQSRLQRMSLRSLGTDWEEAVDALVGAGWDYVEDAANYTLTISAAVPPASTALLRELILPFTPAHLVLIVNSFGGFLLDQSQLDQQSFHP